jgi:ATP-binding cassette subfamily B protein
VSDSTITFPLVVTFTQYIKQFFEPVSLLATRYTVLQSAMSGAERILKLLDETSVESAGKPAHAAAGTPSATPGDVSENEAGALDDVTLS